MQQAKVFPESVGELKFGQVGIANLKIRVVDPVALAAELKQKVAAAPRLLDRTPVVVDLSRLPTLPDKETTKVLLHSIRDAGLMPVGLSYGTQENEQLARHLNLPLFAKFRAAFEKNSPELQSATVNEMASASKNPRNAKSELALEPISVHSVPRSVVSQHHGQPVRSGQQVYARDRDLTLTTMVGHGAEVIADGSIHIYGRLSGRALAGAQGDTSARIYCHDFQPELISIAGHYRVFEEVPDDLFGKPVQAWLEGEKLLLEKIF